MFARALIAASVSLGGMTVASSDSSNPSDYFLTSKEMLRCVDAGANNFEIRGCINASVYNLIQKMPRGIMCNAHSCIMRMKCESNSDDAAPVNCTGFGYSVRYTPLDVDLTFV